MTSPRKPRASKRSAVAHPFRDADALALLEARAPGVLSLVAPAAPRADYDTDGDDPMRDVEVIDGVALVRVCGPLMAAAEWWDFCDSYDAIVARVSAAHESPAVTSVVMCFDSPGGIVSGLFDAMRALRAAKAASGKRMIAHTSAGCYSAAYGLASACDEVVVSDSAGVGSVGVIACLVSRAKELETAGVEVAVVASGAEKTDGHPALPISTGARKRLTERVNALAAMFSAECSAGRPALTAASITELAGGVRYGRDALVAGLADRVASLDAVVSGLRPPPPVKAPARYPYAALAAQPAAKAARTTTMDESTLAALAAITGKTDAGEMLSALHAMKARAEAHDALVPQLSAAQSAVAKLSADLEVAHVAARASADEAAASARTALVTQAKADGKWSPALDGFLASLSVDQLRAYLVSAPRVVPGGAHSPPTDAPGGADGVLPTHVAALVARGWASLSAGEKHAVTEHSPALAARLRNA